MPTSQNTLSTSLTYIPPRLTEGDDWYVSYSVLDPYTNKMVRKRIRLNKIKSSVQRKSIARRLINDITLKLSAGWNPLIDENAPKTFHFLFNILDTYLRIMTKEAEAHSLRSYKSYIKYLKSWLLQNNYDTQMYVGQFSQSLASDIMLEIKEDDSKSFRTYNNYLQFFTTLFNWMMQFNYIASNPFVHLRKIPKKKIEKKRRCLTASERKNLQDWLIFKENYNYLAMCYLCYFCCIRPNEISLLRVKDIDLKNQLVKVDASIAKNDHTSWRTIPNVALPVIAKLNLNYPSDYFLFSRDIHQKFMPGKKRAEGREIARFWSDVIRPALGFPMELQFYSLKDSGITNLLADGISANFVQGQADHSSLAVTSIYAKKVNKDAQEQLRNLAKKF